MSDPNDGAPGPAPSIPISWNAGSEESWNDPTKNTSSQTVATSRAIVQPSARETAIFSDQRIKTCGMCKFYQHAHAQREFNRTHGAFFKELVHDMGWKIKHLGNDPRKLAICGQKDDTLVGPTSRACEYYKPGR